MQGRNLFQLIQAREIKEAENYIRNLGSYEDIEKAYIKDIVNCPDGFDVADQLVLREQYYMAMLEGEALKERLQNKTDV